MNNRTDLISKLKTQIVATESKKSNDIELKTEVEKISDKKLQLLKRVRKDITGLHIEVILKLR